jgi:hypothetical protein
MIHQVAAFNDLIKDPANGGRYVSLTPGHPTTIRDGASEGLTKVRAQRRGGGADGGESAASRLRSPLRRDDRKGSKATFDPSRPLSIRGSSERERRWSL